MRGFLLGLSISVAFIAGCMAGASDFIVPDVRAAHVQEQRWAYFCFNADSVDDVHFKANAAGMRGWEMVTASTNSEGSPIWCFRQPRP